MDGAGEVIDFLIDPAPSATTLLRNGPRATRGDAND